MRTALLVLASVALAAAVTAQQPPPPDLDALAQRAEDFKTRRRIGAAAIWAGLLVASVIIGWVRMKARRERTKP